MRFSIGSHLVQQALLLAEINEETAWSFCSQCVHVPAGELVRTGWNCAYFGKSEHVVAEEGVGLIM